MTACRLFLAFKPSKYFCMFPFFSKYFPNISQCYTWVVLKMCTPALPFLPRTTLSFPDKYMYLQIAQTLQCAQYKLSIINYWFRWWCVWSSSFETGKIKPQAIKSDPAHAHGAGIVPAAENLLHLVGGINIYYHFCLLTRFLFLLLLLIFGSPRRESSWSQRSWPRCCHRDRQLPRLPPFWLREAEMDSIEDNPDVCYIFGYIYGIYSTYGI